MRIYYTTCNNGDGSASVRFFESQECIDYLEENDPEGFGSGEGGSYMDIEGTVTGIEIEKFEDIKSEFEENGYY